MTKYFVDQNGNYLGGFDGAEPPEGAIQVVAPPDDARQKWDGEAWGEASRNFEPLTARQLRLSLVRNGITLAQVDAALEAMENENERTVAQVEWHHASQFERHHPLVNQVGAALGLTAQQIDHMWEQGLRQ